MPVLSNELLNAEQLVAEFEAHVVGQNRSVSHFQKRLTSVYFKGIEDDAKRNARFSSNYPRLNHTLKLIFALPHGGDAAAALEEMRTYEGLDWEADQAELWLYQLNEQFGFFRPSLSSLALFKKLVEASRVMIVLFEQNNTPEETMAYEYAYKLMALFGPIDVMDVDASFKRISLAADKVMSASVSNKGKPYHDVLQVQTELPDAHDLSQETRDAWQKLIKKEGERVLTSFAKAAVIQVAFNRVPRSLQEAKSLAMQCRYERANEDEDFAVLCSQHDVTPSVFNGGLDYMRTGWPKKTSDALPCVTIKDEAGEYYWLKLPPNDKRALILGSITHCCQDITGQSKQCVKDAVSLSDNGLYVLLKSKKDRDTGDASPMKGDEINHDDFDIVGQSYAWRTTAGNICLDSIECSLDAISNDTLKSMMHDFAHEVMRQKPEVKRVNVGRGGKTPPGLFEPTSIAEQMRQGALCGDAVTQYVIAHTQGINAAHSERAMAVTMTLDRHADFCECIEYLSYYAKDSSAFTRQLSRLLGKVPTIASELTGKQLMRLFCAGHVPCLDDLYPIDVDAMKRMSPEEIERISTARFIFRADTYEGMLAVLPYISASDRLAVVKEKNALGETFLHAAAPRHPESLRSILALLSESECLDAVREKNLYGDSVLHVAASHPESLRVVLEVYPESDRLAAVKEKNLYGDAVLHFAASHPESLRVVLALYPESDRLAAVEKKNLHHDTVLHVAAESHPESLRVVLALYPESDRLAAVMEENRLGDTVLHAAASHPESLRLVLALYPESDRLAAVEEKNLHSDTVLHIAAASHPESLRLVLALYPESDRLAALMEQNLLCAAARNDPKRLLGMAPNLFEVILESLSIPLLLTLLRENSRIFTGNHFFSESTFIRLKRVVVNKLTNSASDEQMTAIHDAKDSPGLLRALKAEWLCSSTNQDSPDCLFNI